MLPLAWLPVLEAEVLEGAQEHYTLALRKLARRKGKSIYTVDPADRASVAALPDGPCAVEFTTPCGE